MEIMHITELFALDDEAFIQAAYRCLLNREPDQHGMAYYLGRLAQGYDKAAVIAQLAQSPECRPVGEIKGLGKLMTDERRAWHWFWGLFGQRHRLERTLRSGLNAMDTCHQQSALLRETLGAQTQALGQIARQIEAFSCQTVQWQAGTHNQSHAQDDAPQLPAVTVREVFVEILGREPESEEVIKHHARFVTRAALRETLMNAEEFKLKIKMLPEYARRIFLRQIQLQSIKNGA
ncbi:MAG TPA: DUF4214 domain-containing protein [Halothiobacillus sp.]|nr:DUF4214 domain-containing protein [Halothiobacillus sp.]